ncbi:M23 family metallopeptidase [Novosphingobium resinovorum]|uniref:M23 family metallopeptidase n=1 Tax=Novosphingobium resinovorum TaxID=158500 RepID=UPI002ED34DA4|nr:M23 family metallopeptidase [Novosphingobium resinovorum]
MTELFVDSYDPRRWAAAWSPRRPLEVREARRASNRRRLAGLGAGGAIVLAGVLAAWLARPDGGATADAVVASGGDAAAEAAPAAETVRRTLLLANAGELEGALTGFGIDAVTAAKVAAEVRPALAPQGEVRAVLEVTREGGALRFYRLQASNADSSGAAVRLGEDGAFETTRLAAQVSEKITVMHGIMDGDSFYTSAVAIGVPNSLISPFAKALAFDFDFQREVAAGDAFELAYAQSVNAAGEAQGAARLLYAAMTTQAKSAAVYRFTPPSGEEGWYDASGRTVAKSLMRTPVDGARITSKFGMRFHPVLHYTRLHGGVDFAAPIGTPIYAAAAGTVTSASPSACAGNMVIISHANGMETRYFHLVRYAEGLHAGQQVPQGFTIGYVGTTGTCTTGPHLHYEIHVNGEKIDPLSFQPDPSESKALDAAQMREFEQVRDRIDVSRAQGAA